MAQVRTDARPWILQRCCPRCGYSGWELQQSGENAPYECPSCDEDLYARRPLSYAEREAFIPLSQPLPLRSAPLPSRGLLSRFLRALKSITRTLLRV